MSLVGCFNSSLSFPLSKARYRCPSQRVSQRAGGLGTVQRLSLSASLYNGCKILCVEPGPPPNSEASKTMSRPLTLGSAFDLFQPGLGVVQLGWLDSSEQTLSLD